MKIRLLTAAIAASLLMSTGVYASTVVTAPIDSRPISTDYLNDLALLGGDKAVYPDKDIMDMFPADESLNRFADSGAVRESIYNLTGENNREDNTVIINTSTYFTSGLVGSRIGSCYTDIDAALEDLRKLATDYPLPYYYVNLTTPRSLPETRFNDIWRDNDNITGIGYYYLQRNPDCEDCDYIKANFSKITPTQLLMEYSYVCGKMDEGVPLQDWERDFYRTVNSRYMSKDPYRTYLNNYIEPFKKSVDIMKGLIELKKEGLIDEIVISTDDLQLPSSISYFASQDAPWVQKQGGSAVKYSFARTYFETGSTSVMGCIDDYAGKEERYLAMAGRGREINVIYGTDEVPQLIYARDLVRRTGKGARINPIYNINSAAVAVYDVNNAQKLTNAAISFTNGYKGYFDKQTDLYIYSYASSTKPADTVNKMKASLEKGKNIALVELYDSKTLNNSNNALFKLLTDGRGLSITDLNAYSAWNTNGNAIGLGVAGAQVCAIARETTNSPATYAANKVNVLLQHALEDGVYTVQTKRLLSNAGYKPTTEELEESPKLRESLLNNDVVSVFENSTVDIKGKTYEVTNISIDKCGFPWARTFDCILDINTEVKLK